MVIPEGFPWLSMLILAPLIGSIILISLGNGRVSRYFSLLISLIPLVISCLLLIGYFDARLDSSGSFKYLETHTWIKQVGISYTLGVDGLSLPFIFLTALLTTLSIVFSWDVSERSNLFFALLLIIEVGLIGVFASLDFFLFYIFWETVLVPMFFLIAIWGGPNRQYAAMKFLIYTHVASVIMLVGIFAVYFSTGGTTFNMIEISTLIRVNPGLISAPLQTGIFLAFLFGFGVKMPIVPFHTWLPDAHVEAPTAGSVLLAGVLLKMGGYGLIRAGVTLLPEGAKAFMVPMAIIGTAGIIYAAFLCLSQRDFKRLVAYSSVSHMGLVLLGISTLSVIGLNGAIFQMFAHGLITGVLFMMAGVIHHKTGTRDIPSLGGLARVLPWSMGILVVASLASLGLPGMVSFPSEVLVFLATYQGYGFWVIVPLFGVVLTAAYYLWMLQRVAFGELRVDVNTTSSGDPVHPINRKNLHDVLWFEGIPMVVLLILIILFGVCPRLILDIMNTSVANITSSLNMGGFT